MLCADGVWRTLDSKGIHKIRPAAGAVAERTTAERLTASMRVLLAMRPDGKAREVLGIPEYVNALYSSRRRAITPKTAELVEAFETKHGRAPNALELDRLHRQATFVTRRAKSHTARPPNSAWSGSTGSCAPRSTAGSPSSPPTCSPSRTRNRKRSSGHRPR